MTIYNVSSKIGVLIDAYYKNGIKLVVRDIETNEKNDYSFDFLPYFYLKSSKELELSEIDYLQQNLKGISEIIKTEKENSQNIYKLLFIDIESLLSSREHLQKNDINLSFSFTLYEYDIPFIHRFFVDNNLSTFKKIKYNFDEDNNKIVSFEVLEDYLPENLSYITIDLEVLPPQNGTFPVPENDSIISISVIGNKIGKNIFFLGSGDIKDKLEIDGIDINYFTNEIKMLDALISFLKKKDPDILWTYNGDGFDLDYLVKRYKHIKSEEFKFGKRDIVFHKSRSKVTSISGTVHLDVYVLIKLLNYLQVFNYSKFDLNTIYTQITGKPKLKLPPKEMISAYESFDYKKIITYNQDDTIATEELGLSYYALVYEVSKLIYVPVFDVLRSSAGALVEKWFISYYTQKNLLIPNKPNEDEISERMRHTFEGAFVQPPLSGLHRNIAVVDFRSYHISLIITYNISPETIDLSFSDKQEKTEILGHYISPSPPGFVPTLLSSLLTLRIGVKDRMKKLTKGTGDYKRLYAQQYALKILLASTYGYMGFSGARWYCKNCLTIMYHLVRTKIQETIKVFEDKGYVVVYGDTDSCFIQYTNEEKLKEDLVEINDLLPKSMALELEDLFKTGIFVLARSEKKAAKKKYALLDFKGNLKIKGFEFVRRDWCLLVRETQKAVLSMVLEDENPKKAISFVKEVLLELQERKIPNKKLIIQSFVHKKLGSYKTLNPAMSALLDAKKVGRQITAGEVIEFIITNKQGKTISEKSRFAEFVSEGDYDIDYYINNQLIPAIYPILEVFGVTSDELLTGKKQKGLGDFI